MNSRFSISRIVDQTDTGQSLGKAVLRSSSTPDGARRYTDEYTALPSRSGREIQSPPERCRIIDRNALCEILGFADER
jgi:hypothetical protein